VSVVDQNEFKRAMRCWPSGVTVVTSRAGEVVHGMTVSAFASVSAEPPLVLVCANQDSTTHEVIWAGRVFAVNILAADQEAISQRFAFTPAEDRFRDIEWQEGRNGAPLIDGALAHIECRVHSAHAEGTHTIYIGEVLDTHVREGKPLVYYDGAYRKID